MRTALRQWLHHQHAIGKLLLPTFGVSCLQAQETGCKQYVQNDKKLPIHFFHYSFIS